MALLAPSPTVPPLPPCPLHHHTFIFFVNQSTHLRKNGDAPTKSYRPPPTLPVTQPHLYLPRQKAREPSTDIFEQKRRCPPLSPTVPSLHLSLHQPLAPPHHHIAHTTITPLFSSSVAAAAGRRVPPPPSVSAPETPSASPPADLCPTPPDWKPPPSLGGHGRWIVKSGIACITCMCGQTVMGGKPKH